MKPRSSVHFAVRVTFALVALVLAGCGATTPSATNPTPSPSAATSAGGSGAPCTAEAVMVPIQAAFDTSTTQATVAALGGGLVCASGIAKIAVLIGPINPPANGPQGRLHLVLLEDHAGQWVIANDKLCDSAGQPTRPIPAALGQVCGIQ